MMVLKQAPVFLLVIGLVFLLTTAMGVESSGKRHTFEVRNSITSPQYRSDAARAIDAYERLMERYMSLTETNLVATQADGRDMAYRLTRLESTLERIELKLDHLSRTLQVNSVPGAIPTPQSPNVPASP